jgi:serine/threonine protein kinase
MGSCLPCLDCDLCGGAEEYTPFVKETWVEATQSTTRGDRVCNTVNGYTLLKTLGKGRIGKVKLGEKDATNQFYVVTAVSSLTLQAIKIYNKRDLSRKRTGLTNQSLQCAYSEVAILKNLRHPNIVSAIEIIDDPQSNNMYLGKNLFPAVYL